MWRNHGDRHHNRIDPSCNSSRARRARPTKMFGVRSGREASGRWNEREAGRRRQSVGTRWRGRHQTDATRRGSPANADRRRAGSTCTPCSGAAFSVRRGNRDARKVPSPGRRRKQSSRRGPVATSGDLSTCQACVLMIRCSAGPDNSTRVRLKADATYDGPAKAGHYVRRTPYERHHPVQGFINWSLTSVNEPIPYTSRASCRTSKRRNRGNRRAISSR